MCNNLAKFRYTWPGKGEALICDDHARKLRGVAEAIGLPLQFIPIAGEDLEVGFICMQEHNETQEII